MAKAMQFDLAICCYPAGQKCVVMIIDLKAAYTLTFFFWTTLEHSVSMTGALLSTLRNEPSLNERIFP